MCRRSDKINTKNAVVCSEHFTNEDYIDDMKSRLLGIESPRNKRLLKNEGVPSLHLPSVIEVFAIDRAVAIEFSIKKHQSR